MSQMLKSSGSMGMATMTSRLLGMVREVVYAHFMGISWVAGAFTLAFTIPNLFRRLLGEGALTAAFIPLFKEKERTAGDAEMWRAANAVISGLVVAASGVVLLVVLGVSAALGTRSFGAETRLMLELLRIMFPYMLLVCVAAVFVAMLNARGHFFIPAMGTTMLNVIMIASVILLAPLMGSTLEQQIFALAIGVLVAGVAQAAFQLPALRREGFRYQLVSPWQDPTVRTVVRRMIPGTIGVAAFQINVLTTQSIAYGFDGSIVAAYNYAVRLMELPQGVFGISLATYLLPALSGLAADKNLADFRGVLRQGLGHLAFLNLLSSVLLLLLATPIVRLLFERGDFDAEATRRTGYALACLAPGLVAFSAVNILARAFYALGDTRTPMKVSIVCLALNVVLVAGLIGTLAEGGLGIANTTTAVLNAALLTRSLRRKLGPLQFGGLVHEFLRLVLAAVVGGLVAWLASRLWESGLGHANLALKTGAVLAPILAAGVTYWAIAVLLRVQSANEIRGLVFARIGSRRS